MKDGMGREGTRGTHQRAVAGDGHRSYGHVTIRKELLLASVHLQVPDPHIAILISRNELCLIRVQCHRIHRGVALVLALVTLHSQIPNFDGLILRAREHPLAFTLEPHGCHIALVVIAAAYRGLTLLAGCLLDVEDLAVRIPGRRDQLFVVRNCQSVHLGIWEAERPADLFLLARFPEADLMVVARRREHHLGAHLRLRRDATLAQFYPDS